MTASPTAELFDAHGAGLHRYLARRIGTPAAAALLATAIRAASDGGGPPEQVRSRLFGLATTTLHERYPDSTVGHPVADPDGEPAGTEATTLRRRLAALARAERDALLLVAWGGLTSSEIAVALDLGPDEVNALLGRARLALRATTWTDVQLDGALAVLHSDVVSDAATLGALREQVLDGTPTAAPGGAPDLPAPDGDGEPIGPEPADTAVAPRRHMRALVAVGLAAGLAGAVVGYAIADSAPPAPAAPASTSITPPRPASAELLHMLPVAAGAPSAEIAAIGATASDPARGPGQYLYSRTVVENDEGNIQEEWIPFDPADEWLRRYGAPTTPGNGSSAPDERARGGRFYGESPDGMLRNHSLAELPRDPRLLHDELRSIVGSTVDAHMDALQTVAGTLASQPVPADLRAALFAALGYVPYLQVLHEDGGRTAVLRADGAPYGRPVRLELLVDVATGQMRGQRFSDSGGVYRTHIEWGVADAIGRRPTR